MTTSRPIRTAIIGLSPSSVTSWASAAHLPNLINDQGKSKFQIVALCNSSVASAQAAIDVYGLDPSSTKAYGSPEDLAADADVEFVICSTRVDNHFKTVLPSLKAGKDVYIEWPIASTAEEIKTLVDESVRSGAQVLIGLQGRWAAPVVKLRETVGRVGRVLSVDVRAFGGTVDRETLTVGLKYLAQRRVGGNPITIGVGHLSDFVQSVVGKVVPETIQSRLQLQRPDVKLRDPQGSIVDTIVSDVPDLLHFHGRLAPSPQTDANATLSFSFRRGQPFPDTPSLTWSINGTLGELRIVSPSNMMLQAFVDQSVRIQLHRFDTDTVENVEWDWDETAKQVPDRARSVGKVLYAYADWKQGVRKERDWVDIGEAAELATVIEGIFANFQA